jgi:hypothetical protein
VVREYDPVIGCVAGTLGLELVEDCLSLTGHACPRWWVVVRPPGARRAFCWHKLARPAGLGPTRRYVVTAAVPSAALVPGSASLERPGWPA